MKCTRCTGDFRVHETRISSHGQLRRRRHCASCGLRVTTLEVVIVENDGAYEGAPGDQRAPNLAESRVVVLPRHIAASFKAFLAHMAGQLEDE